MAWGLGGMAGHTWTCLSLAPGTGGFAGCCSICAYPGSILCICAPSPAESCCVRMAPAVHAGSPSQYEMAENTRIPYDEDIQVCLITHYVTIAFSGLQESGTRNEALNAFTTRTVYSFTRATAGYAQARTYTPSSLYRVSCGWRSLIVCVFLASIRMVNIVRPKNSFGGYQCTISMGYHRAQYSDIHLTDQVPFQPSKGRVVQTYILPQE